MLPQNTYTNRVTILGGAANFVIEIAVEQIVITPWFAVKLLLLPIYKYTPSQLRHCFFHLSHNLLVISISRLSLERLGDQAHANS